MTTPGYPDYTRLTRSGGVELGAVTGNITNLQKIFQGYVGNFPYIALTASLDVTLDFVSIDLVWFSDSTFTTSVGFRRVIRSGSQFSETQYVNLSDWLTVQVETKSGAAVPFLWISAYGCQGPGGQFELVSMDVPILSFTQSVPASTTSSFTTSHVQPGNAMLLVQTVGTNWFINVNRYDWGAGAYQLFRQYNSSNYPGNIAEDLPQIDAPYKFDIHNSEVSARTFVFAYLSK